MIKKIPKISIKKRPRRNQGELPRIQFSKTKTDKDIFLKMQQNSEINQTSKSFTTHIYLTEQTDQMKVKKLSVWEQDNLSLEDGKKKDLYLTLSTEYKREGKVGEQKEIEKFKTILDQRNKRRGLDEEAATRTNNKVLQQYIEKGRREQGTILFNSISKTKSRFDFSLFDSQNQKKLQMDLGVDSKTLVSLKGGYFNNDYYRKIIKEKTAQEESMKLEISEVTIKIFDKKSKRINLENKLNELYVEKGIKVSNFNEKKNHYKKYYLSLQQQFEEDEKSPEFRDLRRKDQKNIKADHKGRLLEIETKIASLSEELNDYLKGFSEEKQKITKEISFTRNEENYYKNVSREIAKGQQKYYLDILQKGYDVRGEGLSWVVKRLLELQTNLEYHHFPKFLDNQQCDYLMKMADMSLEQIQLKIVLQALKNKQKNIQLKENMERFNKIANFAESRHQEEQAKEKKFDFKLPREEEPIAKRLFEIFNRINQNHRGVFKIHTAKKEEEVRMEIIQKQIRDVLIDKGSNEESASYNHLNSILDFFQKNKDSKDFLEIILNIRARLNYLLVEKEKLKEEQHELFKQSQSLVNRFSCAKTSLQYDLIYSALFGTNGQG